MDKNIMYKVYAKLDSNKCILDIESSAFITDITGFIQIDEGEDGYIYGHAQPNYLMSKYGKPTFEDGKPNFKYDGQIIELTQEEKEKFFPKPKPQPTEQEQINANLMREIALLKAGVR